MINKGYVILRLRRCFLVWILKNPCAYHCSAIGRHFIDHLKVQVLRSCIEMDPSSCRSCMLAGHIWPNYKQLSHFKTWPGPQGGPTASTLGVNAVGTPDLAISGPYKWGAFVGGISLDHLVRPSTECHSNASDVASLLDASKLRCAWCRCRNSAIDSKWSVRFLPLSDGLAPTWTPKTQQALNKAASKRVSSEFGSWNQPSCLHYLLQIVILGGGSEKAFPKSTPRFALCWLCWFPRNFWRPQKNAPLFRPSAFSGWPVTEAALWLRCQLAGSRRRWFFQID